MMTTVSPRCRRPSQTRRTGDRLRFTRCSRGSLPRRVVVIQASGDGYLPAARARELFGVDSTDRRLVTIDAHNHRFNGGEDRFAAALLESVSWLSRRE